MTILVVTCQWYDEQYTKGRFVERLLGACALHCLPSLCLCFSCTARRGFGGGGTQSLDPEPTCCVQSKFALMNAHRSLAFSTRRDLSSHSLNFPLVLLLEMDSLWVTRAIRCSVLRPTTFSLLRMHRRQRRRSNGKKRKNAKLKCSPDGQKESRCCMHSNLLHFFIEAIGVFSGPA